MGRRVHQAIELDQSLRKSRAIWLSLAVLFVPGALAGFVMVLGSPANLSPDMYGQTYPGVFAWDLLIDLVVIAVDIFVFGRVAEASKRLDTLREDPNANVRPLSAPFQASLFGPYH